MIKNEQGAFSGYDFYHLICGLNCKACFEKINRVERS